MRRIVWTVLCVLEIGIAGVLVYVGLSIPRPSHVGQGFDRMESTTRRASNQVEVMRRQMVEVRRPEMLEMADKLQKQTQTVTATMKKQQVDFKTVVALRDSLDQIADGLDSTSDTLDPERLGKLSAGFGETAKFLDDQLIPASDRTADQLEKLNGDLAKDAEHLAELLREAPPDLKAAKEIYDSLEKFDDGLDKMLQLLELKRLDSIKEGFSGLDSSLSLTAGEVERLSGYKYPVMKVRGLKVEVEEKPFWPNGDKIADGLRKASEGVKSAQSELDNVGKDLPQLRKALEESRKVVAQTRTSLGQTLKQRDKLEPLMRDIPVRTARLAEDLPKLGKDLAKLLRETKQLKEVSAALRQAQKGIESAVSHWPNLRANMKRTSDLLKMSSRQLDQAIQHRQEYEAALQQSTDLAETFALTAPMLVQQIETQMAEQERSLTDLEKSLDDVGDSIPTYKSSAMELAFAGRLLAFLIAGLVGLHATFVTTNEWRKR
jgi:septation ring formation regulator EzrA